VPAWVKSQLMATVLFGTPGLAALGIG